MKKRVTVEKVICDLCGNDASLKCEICGKDICQNCARYICRKRPDYPSSYWSASYSPFEPLYTPEMIVCKECINALKLSLRVSVGKSIISREKRSPHRETREVE